MLKTLLAYRLIDPGSEWRLHRHWFDASATADLLESDFGLAEKNTLYRCLDRLTEHKDELFKFLLRRRNSPLLGVRVDRHYWMASPGALFSVALVLFGTDMQVKRPNGALEPDTYTLEFKTTPCEITDVQGREDRLAAGKVLVDEIKRAQATEDGLMAPFTSGELALSFTGQLQLLPPKTRTDEMIFGNQLTVGISNRELLEAAGSKRGKAEPGGIGVQALLAEARWAPAPRVRVLRKHFAAAHKTEEGFTPHAAAAYALRAALAEFMARAYRTEAIRRKLAGGNRGTSEHAKEGPSIDWTNPIVKNSFGVLPKTPPLTWLVTLEGPWRTVVKSALTPQAPGSTEGAEEYAEAVGLILSGSMIAGHKPPAFLIKDSVGSAFEFRTPTLEQSENFQPNTKR